MTEAEWLGCTDPQKMLAFLRGKASERKHRLFACACCRRLWNRIHAQRVRRAVEIAELVADGLADREDLRRAEGTLVTGGGDHEVPVLAVNDDPFYAARRTSEVAVSYCGRYAEWEGNANVAGRHVEVAAQSHVLRDLFGNPFRPVAVSPSWLSWNDSTVVKLAQRIYDERAFDRLPVLADALEEAGCTNVEVLGHLRSPGPHVRGCWAVDLVLSKE